MLGENSENMIIILLALAVITALGLIIYNYYNLGSNQVSLEQNSQTVEAKEEMPVKAKDLADEVEQQEVDKDKGAIYVHISGAVKEPGAYRCNTGARIYKLVEKAGGITEEAALNSINLVTPLKDGDKIVIPTIEAEQEQNLVNINRANKEELTKISGIGEVTAENIIAYRRREGGFNSIEELMKISGIGERTYQQIKDSLSY